MKKLLTLTFLLIFMYSKPFSQKLDLKVYLEGNYNNGSLSTILNDANAIPKIQPFNTDPWNYIGTEEVTSIPENIVDWILVNLRTTENSQPSDFNRAGFLRNDGKIVDLDGTSSLDCNGLTTNDYYVALYHRNHLPIMSSSKVRINETTTGNISGRVTDNSTGDGLLTEVRIIQILTDGNQIISIDTTDTDGNYSSTFDYIITGVTTSQNFKDQFSLGNYPNPYNPSTNLVFNIAESGNYKLEVFDITGRRILENKVGSLSKGNYEYKIGNLGSAGVKLARLIGKTSSGKEVQLTAKLLQMDGSNGTPFVKSKSSGISIAKLANINEQIDLEITYTYLGDLDPGYNPTTITRSYENNLVSDIIDVALEEITNGKTYNWQMSVSDLLDEFQNNIEVTLKNKGNNIEYKDTSDATGILEFNMTNITNPEFILTFKDLTNTEKEYIDKMKLRTIKTRTLDNGTQADLVYNIDGSDWNDNGTIVNITNPEHFWFFEKGYELWYTKGADELPQMTINADEVDSYQNKGKPINLVIMRDEYETNVSGTFPDAKIRFSDPKLHDYYDFEGNNQFRKDKILYNILSSKEQWNNQIVPQEALDQLIYVNGETFGFLSNSSLNVPYLKILTKWVDNIQNNEYLNNLDNQGNSSYFD